MFELKITGKDYEEFKLNLKIACQNILHDLEEDVSLSKGPIKTEIKVEVPTTEIKEEKNESKKRQKRRKEEVITSPLPSGEEVNDLNDSPLSPEDQELFEENERQKAKLLEEKPEPDYSKIEIVPIEQLKGTPPKVKIENKSHPTKVEYYSPSEVKDLFMEVFNKAGRKTANSMLAKYGVEKVSQLSEANYQLLAADCLDFLAVIDANETR